MNYKLFLILISFSLFGNFFPQNLQLEGKAAPGNIMIGRFTNPAGSGNLSSIILDSTKLKFDKSGIFIFGFDRDCSGSHLLKANFKNGYEVTKEINLSGRKYEEQRLNNMKQRFVNPPKKEMARINKESELIKKARAKIGIDDSAYFCAGFIKPVRGGRITSVFGSQRILNGEPKSPHNGIDIAVPKGTPVYAATDGIVRLAGKNFYYTGNIILLDHGQGLSSTYMHLKKILVKEGQQVHKGQQIGEVGTTGRSTGPHLHWGVQWYANRIDPMSLLEIGTVQ